MCKSINEGGKRCIGCITTGITKAQAAIALAEAEGHAGKKQAAVISLEVWEERHQAYLEEQANKDDRRTPVTRKKKDSSQRLSKLVNLALTDVGREDLDRFLVAKGISQAPGEPLTKEAIATIRSCFNSPGHVDTSVPVEELAAPRNTKAKGFVGRPPSKQGTVRSERVAIKLTEDDYARYTRGAAYFGIPVGTFLRYKLEHEMNGRDLRRSESHMAERKQDDRESRFIAMERGRDLAEVYSEAAIYGERQQDDSTHVAGDNDTKGDTDTTTPQGADSDSEMDTTATDDSTAVRETQAA